MEEKLNKKFHRNIEHLGYIQRILPSLSFASKATNASLISSSLNFFHTLTFNCLEDVSTSSCNSLLVRSVDLSYPINFVSKISFAKLRFGLFFSFVIYNFLGTHTFGQNAQSHQSIFV